MREGLPFLFAFEPHASIVSLFLSIVRLRFSYSLGLLCFNFSSCLLTFGVPFGVNAKYTLQFVISFFFVTSSFVALISFLTNALFLSVILLVSCPGKDN